ncbi:Transmembrane protein [Melia azedarach]|uniref:Transmembrane protein n=1 Tax=Melia azedarach TaxID=155640 RepID=A0ACC1YX70_MELAZ|nr:Transmembrane protein [Melia azedarach]
MASSLILHNLCSISAYSSNCYKNQTLALSHSRFLYSNSFFKLKRQSLLSDIQTRELRTRKPRSVPVVYAAQSNFFKVLQTVWKVGKDGIEAGTNLVPDSVPRPVARLSVTIVALTLSLFILKSFLSTAFFVLATMGLAYFIYIALNKDDGGRPKGGGDSSSPTEEDPLEEARRIMEKYK